MWLIQIRALRKKLQLTLRRKEVSERERREGGGRGWEMVSGGVNPLVVGVCMCVKLFGMKCFDY